MPSTDSPIARKAARRAHASGRTASPCCVGSRPSTTGSSRSTLRRSSLPCSDHPSARSCWHEISPRTEKLGSLHVRTSYVCGSRADAESQRGGTVNRSSAMRRRDRSADVRCKAVPGQRGTAPGPSWPRRAGRGNRAPASIRALGIRPLMLSNNVIRIYGFFRARPCTADADEVGADPALGGGILACRRHSGRTFRGSPQTRPTSGRRARGVLEPCTSIESCHSIAD